MCVAVLYCGGLAVTKMYEDRLKQLNPTLRTISYDISDLYRYIDEMPDLSCLVLNPSFGTYEPRAKDWIKQQVFNHLKGMASQ